MRRPFPSCSGSAPTSIHARPSATKATPARPTAKPHAIAASFPSSRPRRTRRTGPPSSPERSTGGVPASSRPSASSNASSASPYAARRQSETLLPSSRSSQASSWPNPSTRPRWRNSVAGQPAKSGFGNCRRGHAIRLGRDASCRPHRRRWRHGRGSLSAGVRQFPPTPGGGTCHGDHAITREVITILHLVGRMAQAADTDLRRREHVPDAGDVRPDY